MLLLLLLIALIIIFLIRIGLIRHLRPWLQLRAGRVALPKIPALEPPVRERLNSHALSGQARELWYSRGRPGQAVLIAIVLTLLLLMARLIPAGGVTAPHTHLVVAVAPFTTSGSEQDHTGAIVARDLVRGLTEDQRYKLNQPIQLTLLAEPIESFDEAAREAEAGGYDVIIWGSVEPGAIADSSSLHPFLFLSPRQPVPFASWPGARARLVLPATYDVSDQPINGLVLLGPLLDALDLYLRGGAIDEAVQVLNELLEDYDDVLSPKLPATLLGTIRWGQGDLDAAQMLFNRALDSSRNDPVLWNNLAVVLHDRGDRTGAAAALAQSLNLAREFQTDLAAAHFNRGLLHLDAADPALALAELSRAVELQPDQPTLLIALASAQRQTGDMASAAETLKRAQTLTPEDPALMLELARLELARLVGDGEHIEWGLEIAHRLPLEPLTALRTTIDGAVALLESRVLAEQQAAARDDVRRRQEAGRLHEALARRFEAELNEARYWQALALVEEGRQQSFVEKSMLASFWDSLRGKVSPLEQGRQNIAALFQRTNSYRSRYQEGRATWLLGERSSAEDLLQNALELDPGRPEAYYGLAVMLWEERPGQERDDRLRELLHQAIAADERFYPARRLLARLEMRSERWEAALEQLDWLVARRPEQLDAALSRGYVLGRLKRYADAELQLLPLANGGNISAMVELALIYREAGHSQAAEDVLRRAFAQDKSYTRAAYELALLLHSQGREQEAASILEEAVRVNPGAMEAQLLLGQLYAGPLNKPEQAIDHYQRAIEAGGSNPRNYETLGELFLKANAPGEAIEALQRAIALDPDSPEAYHKLATAYLRLGDYQRARRAEEAAIQRVANGLYPEALAGIGDSYRLEGRFDQAVAFYSRALDQNPDLVEAYIGLGRTAAAQSQWQMAIDHYQRALELQPDSSEAHYWLASALLQSGNYESALSAFEAVLEQDPEYVEAYYGAGQALTVLGKREEALAFLEEALRRRPGYAEALLARGKLLEQAGLLDEALADFKAAAQADSRLAEPLYLQGIIYIGRSNFGAAVEALEEAVSRQETFAEAHYWLGRAYRAQNRNDEAYRELRRAVELQPGYTEARYYLALAEEERGNRAGAIAAYEAVLAQASPDSPWHSNAQQALDRLR